MPCSGYQILTSNNAIIHFLVLNQRWARLTNNIMKAKPIPKRSLFNDHPPTGLVPLSSIPTEDLGRQILLLGDNIQRTRVRILVTKSLSLASSAAGLAFMPLITSAFLSSESSAPSQATLGLLITTNLFVGVFCLTPLLLQTLLVGRFVDNIYYNPNTKIFTAVHYGLLFRRIAIRFRADELKSSGTYYQIPSIPDGFGGCAEKLTDEKRTPTNNRSIRISLMLPMSTCVVRDRWPIMLSLEPECYIDRHAFSELTKNVEV